MSLNQQLEYLYQLERFEKIKPGLAVMEKLLAALGQPHLSCPTIHLAGTNGKGSTAAILANTMTCAGYKTGMYTSPHLCRFNERVQINNQAISDKALGQLIKLLRQTSRRLKRQPTFFEFTTALAFLYFAHQKVDLAVIEVGLGGGLDATNVITPLVSIITNIGHDHENWLGKTKLERAKHKAGIIKSGIPVVTAETDQEILDLFDKICHERKTRLLPLLKYLQFSPAANNQPAFPPLFEGRLGGVTPPLAPRIEEGKYPYGQKFTAMPTAASRSLFPNSINGKHTYSINLLGTHQITNAGTAFLALQVLQQKNWPISPRSIRQGFATVKWPGRLDIWSQKPFILADGAHNPEGLESLKQFLDTAPSPPPDICLLGVKQDKTVIPQLKPILSRFRRVIVTEANYLPQSANQLANQIKKFHPQVRAIPNPADALTLARRELKPNHLLLITGSLYLIGDVMKIFSKKRRVEPSGFSRSKESIIHQTG